MGYRGERYRYVSLMWFSTPVERASRCTLWCYRLGGSFLRKRSLTSFGMSSTARLRVLFGGRCSLCLSASASYTALRSNHGVRERNGNREHHNRPEPTPLGPVIGYGPQSIRAKLLHAAASRLQPSRKRTPIDVTRESWLRSMDGNRGSQRGSDAQWSRRHV